MDNESKIRQRTSYKRWKKCAEEVIRAGGHPAKILPVIHDFVENIGGYGYARTAQASKESMVQLLRDTLIVTP